MAPKSTLSREVLDFVARDQAEAWGPEEIADMDDKLSFKGRIERDGWVEQAKKLAAEKE